MKSILMIASTIKCGDVPDDVVKTAVITGVGAAKVCDVVGRCDRLCSDEC